MKNVKKMSAFFFISIIVLPSYSMEKPSEGQKSEYKQDRSKGKGKSKASSSKDHMVPDLPDSPFLSEDSSYNSDDECLYQEDPEGTTIQEMIDVYEDAPEEVKDVVKKLKYPHLYRKRRYKGILLVGEPGAGKSILAKAIAREAGWDYEVFSCSNFEGIYRNETSKILREELQEIVDRDVPTVAIINEIEQLVINHDDKHHDTRATSRGLWNLLDHLKNNLKFFVIGTTNDASGSPEALKSRFRFQWIKIKPDIGLESVKIRFKKIMIDPYTKLDDACDEAFLNNFLASIRHWTGRDFEGLADVAVTLFRREDMVSPVAIVKPEHLIQAVAMVLEKDNDSLFQYGVQPKTEEQRKHEEMLEMHERHFVQSQLAQIYLSSAMFYDSMSKSQWVYSGKFLLLRKTLMSEIFNKKQKEIAQELGFLLEIDREKSKKESGSKDDNTSNEGNDSCSIY